MQEEVYVLWVSSYTDMRSYQSLVSNDDGGCGGKCVGVVRISGEYV